MAPRGALFQHLADLEQAASRERQLACQRLHQQRSGEILTTSMAFPLEAATERMAEGMGIGDAVQLVHVTDNPYDANAIEVRWRGQWIGFIPRQRGRAPVRDQRRFQREWLIQKGLSAVEGGCSGEGTPAMPSRELRSFLQGTRRLRVEAIKKGPVRAPVLAHLAMTAASVAGWALQK